MDGEAAKDAGAGLAASGLFDVLTGFARSRIENNGVAATDAAIILSANAALGLYDLDGTTGGTSPRIERKFSMRIAAFARAVLR